MSRTITSKNQPLACANTKIGGPHRRDPWGTIRTGKDTGLGHFPYIDFKVNAAWLTAAMIACTLLAWLKLLARSHLAGTTHPQREHLGGHLARDDLLHA